MPGKVIVRAACVAIASVLILMPATAEVIEEIITQVNDHAVMLSEYKRSLETIRQDIAQEGSRGLELEAKYNDKAKDALRDLIDQQLLVQKAAEDGINAEADVVKRLDA